MFKFLIGKMEKKKTVFITVSEAYPKMTDSRYIREAFITNILTNFEDSVMEVTFRVKKDD